MRLIDADALLNYAGNCYDEDDHLLYAVGTGTIMRMPTIDAVQVVRCKDCAWGRPDGDYESVWLWCRRVHGLTRKNDFCPYGERRCENV